MRAEDVAFRLSLSSAAGMGLRVQKAHRADSLHNYKYTHTHIYIYMYMYGYI